MRYRVMTFNVQHFRNYNYPNENRIDLDFFAEYIARKGAAIVGLNEVFDSGNPDHDRQVFRLAQKAGYPHAYFAKAVRLRGTDDYSNALVSQYPFAGETIPIPDPRQEELNGKYAETRCVLRADFELDGQRLTLLCCHFGLNDAEARNAVQTVCALADTCDNPMLLMGDFNLEPSSPILSPLYARFVGTEAFLGAEGYTFPSDAPRMKIDYIFTRGCKAVGASVQQEIVSDHRAILAEIEL